MSDDSYGSHVLHSLQRFINTHNNYVFEHDQKLKMLEHRLTALESAQQAPAQAPAQVPEAQTHLIYLYDCGAIGIPVIREFCERIKAADAAKGE